MTTERQITRVAFTIHSFDADAFGHLAPTALAGYLQEAAGRSAEGLGFGLAALTRRGATWVLARQRVELDQPVRMGEVLEVETWPAGLDRLAALRDFRLWRDGIEIGRAATTWFAIDLASRKPLRPAELLPESLHPQPPHVLPMAAAPLPTLDVPELERRFQVRFADIDVNEHVTNSSYLAWALEAIDETTWRQRRVSAFDVQFLAECRRDAYVRSRSAALPDGARLHELVREADSRPLARVRTSWAPRRD